MKKLFTLLIPVLLFAAGTTYGQLINAYTFTQSSATYTPLSGATVLGSGSGLDENTYLSIPIGFTFNFNGVDRTTISTISCNGYLIFGYNGSFGYKPISTTTAATSGGNGGVIAPLARDLQGIDANTQLRYKTEGTAPNRTCTVEWYNFKPYGSSYAGCVFTFAIVLEESTNKAFLKYDGSTYVYSSSTTVQVGLRGAANTDYNNRQTTSDWSATASGSSNSATCTLSTTCIPPTGLIFTYSPPSILPPTNFTATAISSSQINLGWALNGAGNNVMLVYNTTNTFGIPVEGTTYEVGNTISGGGTVLYSGNGTSFSHSGLTPATMYYYRAYSVNGSLVYSNGAVANATTLCVPAIPPYYEGFEGITVNNELPPCWTATSIGSKTRTYIAPTGSYNQIPHSGSKFGSYYYYPYSGSDGWFFTRQVHLEAGQTYLAGIWYITDGYSGWNAFEMYYGTAATAASMTNFVAGVYNQMNTSYLPMNSSFIATTTGDYYFGLRMNNNGVPYYFTIDDFSVELLTLPNCAINPSPADGATGTLRNPTLSWGNGGMATDYDVYAGTTNPPPFYANTTATSISGIGFPANSTVYWKVVPHNILGYAVGCPTWSFTTGSSFQYCNSSATSNTDEDIVNVTLNTLNNTSASNCNMYTDYTGLTPTNLIGSFTYPMAVTWNRCGDGPLYYTTTLGVYIDWNQNGSFDVPSELAMVGGPYYNSALTQYTFSGNITVPLTAVGGQTRMRLVLVESSSTSPCGTYSWGETEDYLVNIIPYDKDLTMLNWVGPKDDCNLTANELVTVTYKNLGLQAQNNYNLKYYNGTSWVTENVTTPINPGETKTYTFTTPLDAGTFGEYVCQAAVELAGDVIPTNDLISGIKVRNYPTILVTDPEVTLLPGPYYQEFDAGNAYWYPNGVNNQWVLGTPAKTFLNGAKSAPNAWVTQLTGNYSNNSFCWVESPCFDLSQLLNPLVSLDLKYQTEANWDGALLMSSIDNGSTWYLVGDIYQPTNWYNDTATNGLPVWGGQSAGNDYVNAIHALSGLAGQPSVKLGVLFIGDEYVNFEGVAFDNVRVYESTILFASCPDINIEGTVGDTLNLKVKGGQPPYNVSWTPNLNLSCNDLLCGSGCTPQNCLKPIAAPPVTTTYTAKVWDSKYPVADTTYATATVFHYPELVVNADYDADVCDTARTQIWAFTQGGVPPYVYEWSPVSTLSNPTISNPVATPNNTTTYTVTVTDALGFIDIDNVTITTHSGYPNVDIHPNGGSVCTGDGILLTATGGWSYQWSVYPVASDPSVNGSTAMSINAHPTVNNTKYTCVIYSDCGVGSDFVIIGVKQRPVVSLAPFSPAGHCVYADPVTLTGGNPAGGVYSGNGVVDGVFYPDVAGAGTHIITYTYTSPVNGCPNSATQPMIVYPRPNMVFNIPDDVQCVDAPAYVLTGGLPLNGTYSGDGVDNGIFYPDVAGVGTHAITYEFISQYGCYDFRVDSIYVLPLPVVTLDLNDSVCINSGSFELTGGLPPGGVYSGPGVSAGIFDPLAAGVGVHTISYYYDAEPGENGCDEIVATGTIEVWGLPEITADLPNEFVCEGTSVTKTFELSGPGPWVVNWSINGVAQPAWNVSASPFELTWIPPVGETEYAILDVEDANGCYNDIQDIVFTTTVNEYPSPYFVVMNDDDGIYCEGTGGISVGLSGSEPNVTYRLWKDGAYTGNEFVPSDVPNYVLGSAFWFPVNQTLDGDYYVEAISNVEPTKCSRFMLDTIHITTMDINILLAGEFPYVGTPNPEICLGGTNLVFLGVENLQLFDGPWDINWYEPEWEFDSNMYADILTYPTHSKYYYVTVSNLNGCMDNDSIWVEVNNPPSVEITANDPNPVCANSCITLNTEVTQGDGTNTTGYVWYPDVNVDPPFSAASPQVCANLNTTYTVVVTDDNGCEGSASYDVLVIPSPNVVFTGIPTHNICPAGQGPNSWTLPLNVPTIGSGDYSYSWTSEPAGFTSTLRDPLVNPTATTVYTVVITDNVSGCTGTGTYTVVVNDPIVVNLGTSFNICNGTAANLFANIQSGGFAPFSFTWNPALSPTQNPTVIPPDNNTTVYTVTVYDFYGCYGTANVAVTTGNVPVAHAGPNVTICEGSCTTLIGSGGTSYQWFIDGGDNPSTPITGVQVNPDVQVCPTVTTLYELRVTSPCGAAISHVLVTVNPATDLDVWMVPTEFCQFDQPITIIGTPTDANGTFTGTGITDNGDGTAIFTPDAAGNYNVTYTYLNEFGCTYSIDVPVVVHPAPEVTLAPIEPVCLNTAPFVLTGGLPLGGVYSGDGVVGNSFDASIAGIGTHTVLYTYTDGIGCSASAEIEIVVNPLPEIFDVTITNNGHYCNYPSPVGPTISLSGSAPLGSGITYHLVLNGAFTSQALPAIGAPISFGPQTATGVYTVVATNSSTGCSQIMNGSVTVVQDALPTVYNVTGGGSYCAGGTGVAISMDNSNYGITYELYRNNSPTGITHPGVSGPFSFDDVTAAGTYTVIATNDVTGCQMTMAGSATVNVLALPFRRLVGIGNNFVQSITACPGTHIMIKLNLADMGVVYELYYNGQPTGLTRTRANALSPTWESSNWAPGVYTVVGTTQNPPYYCQQQMNGSATINYYAPISVVTNPANAFIDEGGSASFHVVATGDNPGYQWYVSSDNGGSWTAVDDASPYYEGVNTSTLNVLNATYDMTRYLYRVSISGPCNQVNSAAATLYIDPIPYVYLQDVTECASNSVQVPIVFTNADSINAISLTIYYDNTDFSYTGYTGLNPSLLSSQLSVFAAFNWIRISYFDVSNTINTNHGTFPFMNLIFDAHNAGGTVHNLNFDLVEQGVCELSKINGEILINSQNYPDHFVNGTATIVELPVIADVTVDDGEICEHENLYLHVTASHPEGLSYAWTGPNGFTSTSADPSIMDATPDATGTYYVTVSSLENNCVASGSVNVIVHPEPALQTVWTPNGMFACAGSGVEVALLGSEVGVAYELFLEPNNVTPVAIAVGNGGPVTFGPQPVSGSYVVKATSIYGCIRWMTGTATVVINPQPLWFYVTGGGHYCAGGDGRELKLNGSQIGVQYTLLLNACCCQADSIVMTVVGTGSPLSFGYHTTPGYYSVVAVNPQSGCSNNMIGCIPIVIDPLPTAHIQGNSSVCYGSCADLQLNMTGKAPFTIVLSDGTNTFTASSNGFSTLVNVCPLATTTYTIVSVTDANNCTNTGTGSATVTIWSLPEVIVSNTSPVCIGGSVNLHAAANGFGPFTFAWTGPNGFTSTDANPVIPVSTLDHNGVYTVVVTDGNGCVNTGQTTVTIYPLPTVTLEANSPCVGGTLTIYASVQGTGPFTYNWSGPNNASGTTESLVIEPAQLVHAGIYYVTVTDAHNCVNTGEIEVIVHALPVVTCGNNSPVCVGENINLTAEATGTAPFSYSWTGPDFMSTEQNPVLANATLEMAGDYVVTVYDEYQCMNTCTTTVIVNPLPQVCPVYVTEPNVYCFGCIPPKVWLGCSQVGVNYELYRGGVSTGLIVAGDGDSISFGPTSIPGWYTVRAVNATTGCVNWMYGQVEIIEQAPPTATLSGDVICYGETAEMNLVLTGDTYWNVIIYDGVHKDTLYITSSPYTYIPGSGPHILAPTVTTTYHVLLVSDRVCYNVGNSATVVVNPLPNQYQMTGSGYYCNGIGQFVGLNGSQVGVEYTLWKEGMVIATVMGTGGPISFGPQPDGIYTATAVFVSTGCHRSMIGQAIILPNPDLIGYEVSGGGWYCADGSGVNVYLSGSQLGKEYKLLLGGLYTGTTLIGTGNPLTFTGVMNPGIYTVLMFDPISTCTRNMNGSATVEVKVKPTANINGSATICYGDVATLHVTLTGNGPWTFGITDGYTSKVHHSNVALWDSIVNPPASRTYTLTSVVDMYCQNSGTGSAVITVNSPTPFIMTGGGSFCAGGIGVVVGLSGSEVDVNYALLINGIGTGVVLTGTGNPLSFGLQTTPGTYTVVATSVANGCSRTMNGVAVITINPLPDLFNVTGGGSCCIGCNHVFVCLDGSQTGIRYELYINGQPTGMYKNGNGQPFCYDYATIAGIYTIKAVNMQTGCWTWMNGSAEVILYPTAQANISGGASICWGESATLTVTFTAGTAPFSFGLSAGTGPIVTYNNITDNPYQILVTPNVTTTYTLAWVSDIYGCYNNITTGAATIEVTQLPGVSLGTFNPVCIDAPSFTLTGGLPAGGVYSGVGVDNGVFYPSLAGAGSHVITYTYTNGQGCQGEATSSIIVNPLPVVSFDGLDDGYCVDAPAVTLVGNPAGGTFSGPGIINLGNGIATFTPSLAGVGGPYTITYSYTDENGCYAEYSDQVTVVALPNVYFIGLAGSYCLNNPAVELTGFPVGGTFSGNGIINDHFFDPATAGVGTYSITYSYTSGQYCTSSYTLTVTVLPLPQDCAFEGGGICCIGCSVNGYLNCLTDPNVSYQLMKGNLPVGLPKTGNGYNLVWEIFLAGDYHVVATDLTTGCSRVMSGVINVQIIPQPTAVLSGTTSICQGQCATLNVDLTGTAPWEVYLYDGNDTTVYGNIWTSPWTVQVCPSTTTTYLVVSLTDANCGAYGFGEAVVTVNPAPSIYNVTGGGTICEGGAGVVIGLDGSQTGVYYDLYLDGVSTGVVIPGTGAALSFGLQNNAGTYTVHSVSAITCDYVMNGNAVINTIPAPVVELAPIANVCLGTPAFLLTGGYPVGGIYYVDGIQVTYFDPQGVGAGLHNVEYMYEDLYGCSGSASQTVTVYSVPSVTLMPFAAVCFDAPEFALGGGSPVGGTYYVNGVPATSFDPSAYGAGTYQILYAYTDGNGCYGEASQNLVVNPMPYVIFAQFAEPFCLNGNPVQLTGGYPAGGVYSGQHVISGYFNPVEVGDFEITYTYTDGNGCVATAIQTASVVSCAVYTLTGQVTYDNTAQTVMNNVTVNLMLNGTTVASTLTNTNGGYEFTNLAPGVYTVAAASTKPWGGVNSNDALLIMKHFAMITPLTGIRLVGANVNGDATVNSIDALMVAKRFVNQISSFPVGDWAFEVKTVVITNADAVNNFKALCYGDVNGSYTPPFVKTPPTVNLNMSGVKEIRSYESFELPIQVTSALKVGAISLVINYPENLIDVEGVVVNNAASNVLYTALNGELRISWYNMKEIRLAENDALVTLQLKARNLTDVTNGELELILDGISDLGDRNAVSLQNVNLTYPKLSVGTLEYSISNYPNPFKAVTEITYTLPENGNVTLRVYNLLGDVVAVLVNNVAQAANTYQITFDGSDLVPGVYTYKIEVNGQSKEYVKSGRMVISR